MRRTIILFLLLSILFSVPFGWAEKGDRLDPNDSGNPGEPILNSSIEESSRNFLSWWNDHSGYLIVPSSFGYNHLSPTPKNFLNLLLMVGYKGEFSEVVHAQAFSELKNIVSAPRELGQIVSGETKISRQDIPSGVREEDIRCFAAIALGEMGNREALPYLKKALDGKSSVLSAFSAVSIGKLGGIAYRPDLIRAFKESPRGRDPHLRSAYLASLAYLADPMVLPDLIAGLKDRDQRVRLNLVTVFGKMAVQPASSVIDHYLLQYNNRESVRLASVWALAEMGRKLALQENDDKYSGVLSKIEDSLLRSVSHENIPNISANTFLALGYLGTPRAKQVLQSCLTSPLQRDRLAALNGLALMGVYPKVANSEDPIFNQSISAIASCKGIIEAERPDVFKVQAMIRDLALSDNEITASGLVLMCAKSSMPSCSVLIDNLLGSPYPSLVKSAIVSAGMVKGSINVTKSCTTLQGFITSNPLPSKMPPAGEDEKRDLEERVALSYVSLGMLSSDRPLRFLLKKMSSSPDYDGIFAAVALSLMGGIPYRDPLLSTLHDNNNSSRVRSACAFSLGLTDTPGVIEALTDTIKTENNIDVRAHAIFALAMRGKAAAIPVLYSVLTDRRLARSTDGNYLRGCAAIALSQSDPQPFYLVRLKQLMMDSDDANFKAFCALAIGLSGNESCIEELIPLLKHHSFPVRLAASMGIGLSGKEEFLPYIQEIREGSSNDRTRVFTSIACGMLGDISAVKDLTDSIQPKNEGSSVVRIASALGLMLLGNNDANIIENLKQTATDPDPRVRKYASIARFVLGDPDGINTFIENTKTGGMPFLKLDSDIIQFWANQSLPPFFKLRSYLFDEK